MNLNDNALSTLVALTNEPATLKTLSEIIDKSEQQLRALLARLQKDMLIYPTRKRCPISNNVLFDLTEEGRKIIGEREEASAVAQPKKPVKPAKTEKAEAPAPAQPPEDDPMPAADPVLLASANRMLLDRLHGAALALREFGIPELEKADGAEEIQGFIRLAAASWREQREEIARLDADHRAVQALRQLDHEEYKRDLAALKEKAAIPDAPVIRQKKQATPRRPFTVTGLAGYHAHAGKVTLFLDRRLNARSVTLTVDRLEKLAGMAVSYP